LFTTDPNLAREQLSAAAKSLGAPDLAVPKALIVVAEIPLLGTGKTDYVRLKAMAETAVASAA
jgi:acyl-[acyl-carrier-protein]-phospholipid O-acyltransferase/long-chain-fatty-acid--[acyl-carrier-protein] ligase